MTEIESLQERVDAIRATGDMELASRAWHALSNVLLDFTREKTGRVGHDVAIIQRVTPDDVDRLLADMIDQTRS